MKLFAISLASTLFATVSFAQIPITASPTPPTPPQPTLNNCSAPANTSLNGTTWAFNDIGKNIAQIGLFTINPGGSITGRRTTNSLGTILERLADFAGQIDIACLEGTNTPAAGTLQLGGGIGGQIFTWSFPITATPGPNGTYIYTVTSVTTMNLRPYGALDPAGPPPGTNNTFGYGFNGNVYATSGVANRIVGQVPCPDPKDAALDIFALNGYNAALSQPSAKSTGTLMRFISTPVNRRGGGTVTGNLLKDQYATTGAYEVYFGCTGFSMNIAFYRNGILTPSNFEGVFASGDFSRVFILPTDTDGAGFTLVKNP